VSAENIKGRRIVSSKLREILGDKLWGRVEGLLLFVSEKMEFAKEMV